MTKLIKVNNKESKVVETVGFHCGETEDWLILGQSMNQNLIRGGYFIYKKIF